MYLLTLVFHHMDVFEHASTACLCFSGCVYEMFGRECSLSTGDLLKIIDFTITRFTAQTSSNTEIQIPVEYPGNRDTYLCVSDLVIVG